MTTHAARDDEPQGIARERYPTSSISELDCAGIAAREVAFARS